MQKYRDRNGSCIAILFKSIGVRGRFDSSDHFAAWKKVRRTAKLSEIASTSVPPPEAVYEYLSHLCFSDIARYRTIPAQMEPIAQMYVSLMIATHRGGTQGVCRKSMLASARCCAIWGIAAMLSQIVVVLGQTESPPHARVRAFSFSTILKSFIAAQQVYPMPSC